MTDTVSVLLRPEASADPDPRPERYFEPNASDATQVVKRPLSAWELIFDNGAVRKGLILVALALIWEVYARQLNNDLLFPTFTATLQALYEGVVSGGLLVKAWASIRVLLLGFGIGIGLAMLLTVLAITTRIGNDFLETLTAMFNPLPAIALLPLALIWFGLGEGSLLFVLAHSVLWAVALNTHSGFQAVSPTLRMVGRNYGLRGLSYVSRILIPAALGSILSGLKIGWAFAWRTLIAAELVFGVSSGGGGLGWFIYENKNYLNIANVFAGLLLVILIGLFAENVIFRTLERLTIRRWGMHS
ncbi:ABC transporter permease [Arvimicrobium flavum]|uniref:ABC transporter permease n=1 Tax=Arvimicrobium flavum TaxID=3393320 RepID=UPI00237AA2F4|nr:ABC transporter permease [Mesorhizobium shangrilense]